MPNVTDELMFEVLKQIQAEIALARGDLRDVKVRMTSMEESLAGVNRRLDRIDDRLDRLEHRTGLVEL